MGAQKKTLIGLLASHDDSAKNEELCEVLEKICVKGSSILDHYHLVISGGTYDRVVLGNAIPAGGRRVVKVSDATKRKLEPNMTVLPGFNDGGLIMLAYLVTQRRLSIIWSFLTPLTAHWLNPEDLALMRLCDVWRAKRLMNKGSVLEWLEHEAALDYRRNEQELPIEFSFPKLELRLPARRRASKGAFRIHPDLFQEEIEAVRAKKTVALISHDELKPRMVEFAVDHEHELRKFDRILTTGTTGRLIGDATGQLDSKIHRHHSGPFGGDIEIATEILFDLCDTVIFFVDPLHPHPHVDDIRVVFGACMRKPQVRMLANEVQAREWMERVVRKW